MPMYLTVDATLNDGHEYTFELTYFPEDNDFVLSLGSYRNDTGATLQFECLELIESTAEHRVEIRKALMAELAKKQSFERAAA